jgi:hypothetical protein
MAINVDTVYKTVLLLLNKEQRGYITPDEFNKTATQAQFDIYNELFEDYNKLLRQQQPDTGSADRLVSLETSLAPFRFSTSPDSGYASGQLNLPQNLYKLDRIVYDNGIDHVEMEHVTYSEWFNLKRSNLTAPTINYPVYTYKAKDTLNSSLTVSVLPESIGLDPVSVDIYYFVVPPNVVWGFTVGGVGQYIYSNANSTQFTLHETEFTNIVKRILLYSGVIIKDPQIIQIAASQVQQEAVNKKS